MTADDDRPDAETPGMHHRTLPPAVRLEDTVETVETAPAPDPEGGRNPDQHRALRDD